MPGSTQRFCVACGRKLSSAAFPDPCSFCGHVEWNNPVPRVRLLVVWEACLLLASPPEPGAALGPSLPWTYLGFEEHPDDAVDRLLEDLWKTRAESAEVLAFEASEGDGLALPSHYLDIYYRVAPGSRAGEPPEGSVRFRVPLAELRDGMLPERVHALLLERQA